MRASFFLAVFFLIPCLSSAQPRAADSMLLISLREDFEKASKFSPGPQLQWMEVNAGSDSVRLSSFQETELATVVRGKRVLLLIHGMGAPFARAEKYYRQIQRWNHDGNLPAYDLLIGVLWPGYQLNHSRLNTGLVFLKANPHARRAGKKLSGLLQTLAGETRGLDVLTHSMGSKVALFALKKQDGKVDNLFLMAPSIGAKTLGKNCKYGFAGNSVRERVIVFYSRNDPAFQSIGKKMMGHRGVLSKRPLPEGKFFNIDCTDTIRWHSAYWSSQMVFGILEGYLAGEGIGH